jgi:predicted phage gp36 major capsid-like protein
MAAKATAQAEISPEELRQRVAVLKRFRALLTEQRDRFRSYLEVLDKQKDIIETGSADDLLAHVELEEKIVADIFSIQKVVDPLDELYRALVSAGGASPGEGHDTGGVRDDVPDLKSALEDLKAEAVVRSNRNRELLSKRMVEIRSEIKTLRNNPYAGSARRSAFSEAGTASLIDIKG